MIGTGVGCTGMRAGRSTLFGLRSQTPSDLDFCSR